VTAGDDAALAAGFTGWLGHRGRDRPEAVVRGRPPGGFSSETVFVGAGWSDGHGRHHEELVVRMAPSGPGTFPAYDLRAQWEAQRAAAGAGVPVADPQLEEDPGWLGRPFLVMPRIDGHVVDGVVRQDAWVRGLPAADRGSLYRSLVAEVARVHRAEVPGGAALPHRDDGGELTYWEEYLDWSSGGAPVATLVEGLRWCRDHRPPEPVDPVLLWGDVRFENVVFGDDLAVRAVLDWDMTSVGTAEHDLAWFTSLDLTMEHLFGGRASGFPDREATVALYEAAAGRRVRHLEWYETLAMVRSTAVMTRLGYLRREAGKAPLLPLDDNPLLDLLRTRLT
jgi:aminoglycoside phosphotransferase (APT) family kinase protein